MTRHRLFSYVSFGTISGAALVTPNASHAAGLVSVFDPIIPQSGQCVCVNLAPSWGCILQVLQGAINVAISVGIVICVLYLAYAGVMFMLSSANPGLREQGKARIMNGVIGILVILSSWLVVDFVMKVLYDPTTAFSGSNFGPWQGILKSNGNDYCIQAQEPVPITTGILSIVTGAAPAPTSGATLNSTGTGACSPVLVQSSAANGGYTLTASQANALACIAKPESACGANTRGATTVSGKATSASGPWQILVGASDRCHSLNLPACGNLQCSNAYSGGKVKSDAASIALANKCQAAANNLACSASAAACLIQASGGKFSAWTADSRSSVQKACVTSNGLQY